MYNLFRSLIWKNESSIKIKEIIISNLTSKIWFNKIQKNENINMDFDTYFLYNIFYIYHYINMLYIFFFYLFILIYYINHEIRVRKNKLNFSNK